MSAVTTRISVSKTAGKRKFEPNQKVGSSRMLLDEADSISLDSPLTQVTILVNNCLLGSDRSIPNINKVPILVLMDHLSIHAASFPEDEVCATLDEPPQ